MRLHLQNNDNNNNDNDDNNDKYYRRRLRRGTRPFDIDLLLEPLALAH